MGNQAGDKQARRRTCVSKRNKNTHSTQSLILIHPTHRDAQNPRVYRPKGQANKCRGRSGAARRNRNERQDEQHTGPENQSHKNGLFPQRSVSPPQKQKHNPPNNHPTPENSRHPSERAFSNALSHRPQRHQRRDSSHNSVIPKPKKRTHNSLPTRRRRVPLIQSFRPTKRRQQSPDTTPFPSRRTTTTTTTTPRPSSHHHPTITTQLRNSTNRRKRVTHPKQEISTHFRRRREASRRCQEDGEGEEDEGETSESVVVMVVTVVVGQVERGRLKEGCGEDAA